MRITKGALVRGTYSLMRISGLTVDATPEDTEVGIQVADDYAAQLKGAGLDIQWKQPTEYGFSDPDDNSGLTPEMAGPFKKLLFVELCSHFGKPVPAAVAVTAAEGLQALQNIVVDVPVANNPPTLPIGSGNEYDYRSKSFYYEPAVNNDAIYVNLDDIQNYTYDFSQWLVDETLVTVEYDTDERGIRIGTTSFDDNTTTAELEFIEVGGYTLCITVTKTNSTDKFTVRQNFIVSECQNRGIGYIRGL